jgi:hypothetical protein
MGDICAWVALFKKSRPQALITPPPCAVCLSNSVGLKGQERLININVGPFQDTGGHLALCGCVPTTRLGGLWVSAGDSKSPRPDALLTHALQEIRGQDPPVRPGDGVTAVYSHGVAMER